MRLNKLSIAAIIAAIAIPTALYAAGNFGGLPTVAAGTGLTGSELVPADTGLASGLNPQSEVITVQQLRASTYVQASPLAAATVASGAATTLVQLTPAGTLATLTVNLPTAPVDGQRWKLFSTQTITTLTIGIGAVGQTINGTAVTTLSANTSVGYIWSGSNNTWYREA